MDSILIHTNAKQTGSFHILIQSSDLIDQHDHTTYDWVVHHLQTRYLTKTFKVPTKKRKHSICSCSSLAACSVACIAHSFFGVVSFMVCNARDTIVQKLRRWGRGQGAKALRTTTYNQPLEINFLKLCRPADTASGIPD